jgi:hypothetical protein
MQRWTRARALGSSLAVAVFALLASSSPARAADSDRRTTGPGVPVGRTTEVPPPDAQAQEDFTKAWAEYGKSVGNRYLVGLNSLITFPADPVMDTVKPRAEFDKLPLAAGTKYVAGLGTGIMLSIYRASMGAFDVVCAPLTPMKMLSPEPRWMIFPWAHHEEF